MTYCPKCGSTEHPVEACPSLTNPDFSRQQADRMHAAEDAAAGHADAAAGESGGLCLIVLMVWLLLIGTIVLALFGLII